jgi:hypothetical protein
MRLILPGTYDIFRRSRKAGLAIAAKFFADLAILVALTRDARAIAAGWRAGAAEHRKRGGWA